MLMPLFFYLTFHMHKCYPSGMTKIACVVTLVNVALLECAFWYVVFTEPAQKACL